MNSTTYNFVTLVGSAPLFALLNALSAQGQQIAQAQTTQASMETPVQVPVIVSLIPEAPAVGVSVTKLRSQDVKQTGAMTAGSRS
jgi:hypothetical protein